MDDGNSDEKQKEQTCRPKFNDYTNCLLNNKPTLKSKQRFKSEAHNVFTAENNNVAQSSNDDNRLQTFDRITLYPNGTIAGKVCKTDLLDSLNTKCLILMMLLMKIKQNIIQSGHIFHMIRTNINNRRFWIRENKCIIKFNKQSTRY